VPVRVATFNVHAGVDGWGRETPVVEAATSLATDVLFLQEAWRSDTVDLAAAIADATRGTVHAVALATGQRATGGTGPAAWGPRFGVLRADRGLFLDSTRPLDSRRAAVRAAAPGLEPGEWCIAIVTSLPVLASDVVELRHLAKDRARRALLMVTVEHETGPLRLFALHGAHLGHGSIGQYRELARDLGVLCADGTPAILGGDFNCWGPPLRALLGGWQQAGRGRTWPSWRPHSQIDHLFVHGPVSVVGATVEDVRASDHRPVTATLAIRGS
jgi:endonuclease/exonuclease/phosphatase family metal-dependent hydrolase